MPQTLPILDKAKVAIVNPLVELLFAAALIVFLYGVYELVANADNPVERQTGQQHVFWGIIGMVIMISVFGILNLICSTIGCR